MEARKPVETIEALGSGDGLAVLRAMSGGGWAKASDVASRLGIHTATAVKHLDSLHRLGILARRRGRGKTRQVFLYRLEDGELLIRLRLDGAGESAIDSGGRLAGEVARALIEKAARGYGPALAAHLERTRGVKEARRPGKTGTGRHRIRNGKARKADDEGGEALLDAVLAAMGPALGDEGARAVGRGAVAALLASRRDQAERADLIRFIASKRSRYLDTEGFD